MAKSYNEQWRFKTMARLRVLGFVTAIFLVVAVVAAAQGMW